MTVEDLKELAEQEQERQRQFTHRIFYCSAAGCASCGSSGVRNALLKALKEKGIEKEVSAVGTGCMGLCGEGPLVRIAPEGTMYQHVDEAVAQKIVDRHILNGEKVSENLVDTSSPFFSSQFKIVLENCGSIDSENINEYIAAEGYASLAKVVTEMAPGEVIDEIRKSGLRGRGGAGYPTGLKWGIVRKAANEQKYVVCNADEGDPGAFMDRSVLEGDPHRVLEGMAIAGYSVGANQGYIYVRAEYPLAIERLRLAIKHAEKQGLLGNRIFESGFNFRIDLRIGLRLRRGNRAHPFHRGETRQAPSSSPLPGGERIVGIANAHQQRRDFREHRTDHPPGQRLVRRHWNAEERGNQGVRSRREDQEHRFD